jgi:hypothetical protein
LESALESPQFQRHCLARLSALETAADVTEALDESSIKLRLPLS